MKPCRFVPGYGHYLPSHELNCRDTTCEGCQPCTHDDHGRPVRHCTAKAHCGQHLGPDHRHTCPQCIGRVRADITWIRRNTLLLTAAAIEAGGVNTEAAVLAGPAADPFVWSARRVAQLRADHTRIEPLDFEDYHHPLAVLGRWELLMREHYQQPPTQTREAVERRGAPRWTSIASAADYLFDRLTKIAQDPDFDWAQMAAEIHACRSHLEDILNTARRPETGAPCPSCAKAPALQKVYAHWCERETCTKEHDVTGAKDVWRCPDCKAKWSEAEYRMWVADDYLQNATALTASELQMIYGINPSSLRTWAQRDQVKKRGRNPSGQQLYDVEQARAMRERTQKERLGA